MTPSALRAVLQLVLVVAFVGGAAMAVKWMIETKPSAAQRERTEPVYAVRAVQANASFNQPTITVFGEVSARRSVELRALVAGAVIEVSDNLIVGGRVAAGEVLARIDPFSFQGAVDEARANLAEAQAKLREAQAQLDAWGKDFARIQEQEKIAQRDLERARALADSNNVSARAVDERELTLVQRRQALEAAETDKLVREARITQQQAAIDRLEWRLRQAERDLADTVLRAPFDAVVRSENIGLGKRLGASDVVAQLYDARGLDLRFTLSDSQFGRLNGDDQPLVGRAAEVSWAVGDAPIRAKATLERIGPEVSPLTGGVAVIARIEGDVASTGLRPGAFVTVSLPDRGFRDSFRLPEEALYNDAFVYALRRDDCAPETPECPTRLTKLEAQPLAWEAGDVLLRGDLDGRLILTSRLAEAGEGVQVRAVETLGAGTSPDRADETDRSDALNAPRRDGDRG